MELRTQYTCKLTLTATVPSLPCRAGCPKLRLVCLNAECDEESQSLYLSHRKRVGSFAYLFGSYRIATAPEPNSRRLTSLKSTSFDSPANSVGPWPAILGCTTNSYSSINPSSANASGSFTPPVNSPLPGSRLSC